MFIPNTRLPAFEPSSSDERILKFQISNLKFQI